MTCALFSKLPLRSQPEPSFVVVRSNRSLLLAPSEIDTQEEAMERRDPAHPKWEKHVSPQFHAITSEPAPNTGQSFALRKTSPRLSTSKYASYSQQIFRFNMQKAHEDPLHDIPKCRAVNRVVEYNKYLVT
jgi:hypothetical protein